LILRLSREMLGASYYFVAMRLADTDFSGTGR